MIRRARETRYLRAAAPVLAATLLGAAAMFAAAAAAGGSTGPEATAAVASIEVEQTCPPRVPPRSRVTVTGTVRNDGDEQLRPPTVEGDAGTPEDEGDDFQLTFQSGDVNGNGLLDPGETWRHTGGFMIGDEGVTNIVSGAAVSLDGDIVEDLDPCEIDIIVDPVPGVNVGVRPVRGTVLVRRKGTTQFVPLEHTAEIPVGSQIDTTKGAVLLTSGLGGGQTNSSQFFDGLFTVLQARARRALTILRLDGGNFRTLCRRRTAAQSLESLGARRPRRAVRRLWGSGSGRFQTRGRYSSATVRGTRWLVQDRCDGTLTRVTQGAVIVRDFRRRRTIIVRAGQSYLALAPGS